MGGATPALASERTLIDEGWDREDPAGVAAQDQHRARMADAVRDSRIVYMVALTEDEQSIDIMFSNGGGQRKEVLSLLQGASEGATDLYASYVIRWTQQAHEQDTGYNGA